MTAILWNHGSSDKVMSPTEAAYVAGFVDGEGTITIGKATRRESRAGVAHDAIFSMANTNLPVLKSIVETCGNGKIQVMRQKKTPSHHKTGYRVWFTANQIRHVLPQVRPFLRLKAKQADILLKFLASKVYGKNVDESAWGQWEKWRFDIRTLNWKGIEAPKLEPIVLRPDGRKHGPRTRRKCQLEECGRKHYGQGWCWEHYYEHIIVPGRAATKTPAQYVKACAICEKEFKARRIDTECCSRKCSSRMTYLKTREQRIAYSRERRERDRNQLVGSQVP